MKDFLTLASERYSVRAYLDKAVEPEKIRSILEAARLAPTAKNCRPGIIYTAVSEKARAALASVTPCTFKAPVVFIIGYDPAVCAEGPIYDGFTFGEMDSCILCSHMMLEATDLGLGSCWVGRFNEEEVRNALDLPKDFRIVALLPVGYAAENGGPSERHFIRNDIESFCHEI